MAPAILQSLIVPLCSPRGCCVVLAVSECNTAKCSFSAVCPPWEAFDQLRCCVCFKVSLLACSAPWSSGVLSELKPGFLQIVFSRIRRRVHDKLPTFFIIRRKPPCDDTASAVRRSSRKRAAVDYTKMMVEGEEPEAAKSNPVTPRKGPGRKPSKQYKKRVVQVEVRAMRGCC